MPAPDGAGMAPEDAAGRTLDELIAGPPLGAAAIDLLRPVATTLDQLHARGIVHRNLTPSAIIVGSDGRARLRFTSSEPMVSTTVTGGATDEAVYCAPEQATGPVVSHRTDLYAFGCVAFEAITATPPFTLASLLDQASGTVPRATERHAGLPDAVDDVFRQALAATPTDRYPCASALVEALESAFGNRYRPRMRLSHLLRRPSRRLALVLLAVFSVVTVAGAALTGYLLADARDVRYALVGAPVAVGANPEDVEAGAGFVWVSGTDDGSITRIDPRSGATTRIEVGGEPGQLVIGDGAVWVHNLDEAITRVDIATSAVSPPIPGGGGPIRGMTFGGGHVWLSHRDEGTVTRVDARTRALVGEPVTVGAGTSAMEFGSGMVYVLNEDEGTLTRIDAASATIAGALLVGQYLGGVEVDGGTVYVAADGGVVPIREDTFTAGEPYSYDNWTYFDVSDGVMWVVYDGDRVIRRFDVATHRPLGDPVPGAGAEIGRARFAFGRLWLTIPAQNTVVTLAPMV